MADPVQQLIGDLNELDIWNGAATPRDVLIKQCILNQLCGHAEFEDCLQQCSVAKTRMMVCFYVAAHKFPRSRVAYSYQNMDRIFVRGHSTIQNSMKKPEYARLEAKIKEIL